MLVVAEVEVKMVELHQDLLVQVDQEQQEELLVVLPHTMLQMLPIIEVVAAVELEIDVVDIAQVVVMVVQAW